MKASHESIIFYVTSISLVIIGVLCKLPRESFRAPCALFLMDAELYAMLVTLVGREEGVDAPHP